MIHSYLRTVILYLVLIFVIRLMGKRQIGQMEASEFVVTMLVANLAAVPMQNTGIPLYSGLVPILTVLGLELVLSWLILKNTAVRKFLCGKPVILIENGHVLQDNLRRTRVTLDELMGHLREKDVLDIRTVQYAILETDGNLSVFPYPKEMPVSAKEAGIRVKDRSLPLSIIQDGRLSRENLSLSGKDEAWVQGILARHAATREETFLLALDSGGRILFLRKELRL